MKLLLFVICTINVIITVNAVSSLAESRSLASNYMKCLEKPLVCKIDTCPCCHDQMHLDWEIIGRKFMEDMRIVSDNFKKFYPLLVCANNLKRLQILKVLTSCVMNSRVSASIMEKHYFWNFLMSWFNADSYKMNWKGECLASHYRFMIKMIPFVSSRLWKKTVDRGIFNHLLDGMNNPRTCYARFSIDMLRTAAARSKTGKIIIDALTGENREKLFNLLARFVKKSGILSTQPVKCEDCSMIWYPGIGRHTLIALWLEVNCFDRENTKIKTQQFVFVNLKFTQQEHSVVFSGKGKYIFCNKNAVKDY